MIPRSSPPASKEPAMKRSNQIVYALLLLGGGVLITLFSLASSGDTYIVAWGAMLGGMFRLVKALSATDGPQQGFDPTRYPDEPPYSGPQLAGSACTHCQKKIVSH